MTVRLARLGLILLLACACSSAADGEPETVSDGATTAGEIDCQNAPASFDQVSAFAKCSTCHAASKTGEARGQVPEGINFDTEAGADLSAAEAVTVVRAGIMPPSYAGFTLSAAEKEQLYAWAMCD